MRRLRADFAGKDHHPSERMRDALTDIVRSLEDMADGRAEAKVHLASLDCGVGKTSAIVQMLPVLLNSEAHSDVSVIVCAGRLDQLEHENEDKTVEGMIADARAAGMREEDYAVFTSNKRLNKLGRGDEDKNNARVIFTTHAMVMRHCGGGSFTACEHFHYKHAPRQVRCWDEAITPGLAVTLSASDLSSLIKPLANVNATFSHRIGGLYADLFPRKDGDQFTVPNLAEECGVDLSDMEGAFSGPETEDRKYMKAIANGLWFLFGKTVTVRHDGAPGLAMLDYKETFPTDLVPLLVLDASSRLNVRETYRLWENGRGGIKRLLEAPKDYSPAVLHTWDVGGGKTSFKDKRRRARLIQGVANAINNKPDERWLVIHHRDPVFKEELEVLLTQRTASVEYLHWGVHDASNAFKDVPNIVLAGTLFLRPSHYEALGRAAAGHPSAMGPFSSESFEAVRQGEHKHAILQAVCRGRIRKCHGASCPPVDVYIIASKQSRIAQGLPELFPGATIEQWRPIERQLTGKLGAAVEYVLDRTSNGQFVSDVEVREHIGIPDFANFRNRIKSNEDFKEALEEHDIVPHRSNRRWGFQREFNTYFPDNEETP